MKKYKNKSRSCGLCKPHKRGMDDNRTMQERKQDQADYDEPRSLRGNTLGRDTQDYINLRRR